MLNRRTFSVLLASAAAASGAARAQTGRIPLYSSTGPDLTLYEFDVAAATLARQGTVTLPANVQYAWPHPSKKYYYVVSSNGRPNGGAANAGSRHFASAFRVDPATGALAPHGPTVTLGSRPIHISLDHSGRFALIAYNDPANVTVHHIHADGTLGDQVVQKQTLDVGIYAHQVRATPSNKSVTLVTRGNNPTRNRPEDPGAIKVFTFDDGQLATLASIRPGNGLGFGPRHLDFAPSAPFVYVSLERENQLYTYGLTPDGSLSRDPLFQHSSLVDPSRDAPGQGAGPIHVHPNGRFVYQTNRGSGTVDFNGRKVSNGGDNTIAVYVIDGKTGEPTPIQHADGHGYELRTFVIDPSGQLLVAASIQPMVVRDGDVLTDVSAGLAVYRIGADGKLDFVRKVDVDTSAGTQFWSGLLTMA